MTVSKQRLAFSLAAPSLLFGAAACAVDTPSPAEIETARTEFVTDMVSKHGFDRDELAALIGSARIQPKILEAISRPAERTLEWHEYRKIFLTEERIAAGERFWREHEETLAEISSQYRVEPEMIVAIIGVETFFGRITGKHKVLDARATLAFAYPPRSKFFRSELEQFLLLTREEGVEPTAALGSYAGAMGAAQFIPSSYRAYAVDASQDGKRDLWQDWRDVIGSVANYFKRHGWKPDQPVVARATLGSRWSGTKPSNRPKLNSTVAGLSDKGYVFSTKMPDDARALALHLRGSEGEEYWIGFHNFGVITRYNRSVMYALAAHQLGQEIRSRKQQSTRTAQR